jgi:signal transduction histidine kinase
VKVLIADDNAFYARMLQHTLREWGYEVVTVGNGVAACDVLQGQDAPLLAVLDWMMPGIDGPEVCRRIRARAPARLPYLILLTARGGKEDLVTGLQSGADDYICKPFDRGELQARLQVGLRVVELQGNLAARVQELEHALSLARRLEVMGRLAGGVAHDFNNLLTVILGGCELLLHESRPQALQRELVEMIKAAGDRGASLTRQLLAFSRRQVLATRAVAVNALVGGVEKLLRRLIAENITLTMDLGPDVGCVIADPTQLDQVLMNLVLNARDAMPVGGEVVLATRNVDLAAPAPGIPGPVPTGAYVRLSVQDNGCGMDEEILAHLFEPFFTTKAAGAGTGLGLATVYGVVKQSGGHIQVQSRPGEGTTFCLYLPRVAAAAVAVPSPPANRSTAPAGATILLVEDEDNVRAIARHVLQTQAYTVLEARDGEDALAVSARWPRDIDLMLTDVVMPRLGGHKLAEALRPMRPAMRVLYMSGYPGDAAAEPHVGRVGSAYLQKPFSPDALARKVRELLSN